jgi:antitoxin VapB
MIQRKTKIFMHQGSQAVRLPKDFQFSAREVFVRNEGDTIILSPKPFDWSSYLAEGPVASSDYMKGIEKTPPQER